MEKRLEITEAQWRLIHRFNTLCEEMRSEGLGFILNGEDIHVLNVSEVYDTYSPDEGYDGEEDKETEEVKYGDMPLTAMTLFAVGCILDETIGVAFK